MTDVVVHGGTNEVGHHEKSINPVNILCQINQNYNYSYIT